MKTSEVIIMGLCILLILLITSCAYKPPNEDACIRNSADGAPVHMHCAYTIYGNDFEIGMGSDGVYHNYTLWGQNITAETYDKEAIKFSPWSYSDMRQNWLTYCHANPKDCTYPMAVKTITNFEDNIHVNRILVPVWNDLMLKEENKINEPRQ